MNPLLHVEHLYAGYGAAQTVFDLNFCLNAGEVLAIIGRNGSGKSTTMKAITGLIDSRGAIQLNGQRIDAMPSYQRARLGLGYVPEERRIFTDLTVRENLVVGARRHRLDLAAVTTLFPNLAEMLDRPASQMSGGEQQMLAVARTWVGQPRVVLLDEPSEGIAPKIVGALAAAVVALKAQGVAVLLSEQNLNFVARVADRALLMEQGQAVGSASRADLIHPSVAVRRVLGL